MSNPVKYSDTKIIPVKGPITRRILANCPSLMAVEFTFSDVFVDIPHQHPHEQISVVIEGEFQCNLDGVLYPIGPGDSVVFPSNVPHCINCIVPGKLIDAFTPRREDFLK
jgi:quercetin dioxygenase-like cupin family protein